MLQHMQWVSLQEKNTKHGEPKSFIRDSSMPALPLLQKKILSLAYKAFLYINILEKTVQNKGLSVLVFARYIERGDTYGELSPSDMENGRFL